MQKEQAFMEGVELLQHWLDGVVSRGLYANKDLEGSLKEIAARLVDKGLPGLARKLRRIPDVLTGSKDHMDSIFMLLGEMYLFCRKVGRGLELTELEREDLLTYAGVPYPKKQLSKEQVVADSWLYLGMSQDKEENMSVYRHWFYGVTTRTKCLFMEFKFGPWSKPSQFSMGKQYRGSVQFFPSMTPVRISDVPSGSYMNMPSSEIESYTLGKALDHFAWLLSYNPFLNNFIYVLKDVKLIVENQNWYLTDNGENCISLENSQEEIPQLMSLSDHPQCQFVAEYSGRSLNVLSVVVDGMIL